jgi:hypothetical protein
MENFVNCMSDVTTCTCRTCHHHTLFVKSCTNVTHFLYFLPNELSWNKNCGWSQGYIIRSSVSSLRLQHMNQILKKINYLAILCNFLDQYLSHELVLKSRMHIVRHSLAATATHKEKDKFYASCMLQDSSTIAQVG